MGNVIYGSTPTYRAFHRIEQAQFVYGDLDLSLSQFSNPAASKNDARFKSDQGWLKGNHLALLI